MVYLKSFYGLKEKQMIHTIIEIIFLILFLGLILAEIILEFDPIGTFLLILIYSAVILSAFQTNRYRLVRDSLKVLQKNFPPGFDTTDLYLHLDWVWPTIETHLHKEHIFVIQKDHFLIEDLNEISWVYTFSGQTRLLSFLFLEIVLKNGKRRIILLPHSTDMDWSGAERTRQDTEDLMLFLREHYPDIQTGFTKARKKAFLKKFPWYRKAYEWIFFIGTGGRNINNTHK